MTLQAFREDGTVVRAGDAITDFRGDPDVFYTATRAPDGHRTGKIVLGDPFGREVYMDVFSLIVRDEAGLNARIAELEEMQDAAIAAGPQAIDQWDRTDAAAELDNLRAARGFAPGASS